MNRNKDKQFLLVFCESRDCRLRVKLVGEKDVEKVTVLGAAHNQPVLTNVNNHLFDAI